VEGRRRQARATDASQKQKQTRRELHHARRLPRHEHAPLPSSSISSPPRAATPNALPHATASDSRSAASLHAPGRALLHQAAPSASPPPPPRRPHLRTTRSLGRSSGRMRLGSVSSWKMVGGGEKAQRGSGTADAPNGAATAGRVRSKRRKTDYRESIGDDSS
jgi:hypothetical protein